MLKSGNTVRRFAEPVKPSITKSVNWQLPATAGIYSCHIRSVALDRPSPYGHKRRNQWKIAERRKYVAYDGKRSYCSFCGKHNSLRKKSIIRKRSFSTARGSGAAGGARIAIWPLPARAQDSFGTVLSGGACQPRDLKTLSKPQVQQKRRPYSLLLLKTLETFHSGWKLTGC